MINQYDLLTIKVDKIVQENKQNISIYINLDGEYKHPLLHNFSKFIIKNTFINNITKIINNNHFIIIPNINLFDNLSICHQYTSLLSSLEDYLLDDNILNYIYNNQIKHDFDNVINIELDKENNINKMYNNKTISKKNWDKYLCNKENIFNLKKNDNNYIFNNFNDQYLKKELTDLIWNNLENFHKKKGTPFFTRLLTEKKYDDIIIKDEKNVHSVLKNPIDLNTITFSFTEYKPESLKINDIDIEFIDEIKFKKLKINDNKIFKLNLKNYGNKFYDSKLPNDIEQLDLWFELNYNNMKLYFSNKLYYRYEGYILIDSDSDKIFEWVKFSLNKYDKSKLISNNNKIYNYIGYNYDFYNNNYQKFKYHLSSLVELSNKSIWQCHEFVPGNLIDIIEIIYSKLNFNQIIRKYIDIIIFYNSLKDEYKKKYYLLKINYNFLIDVKSLLIIINIINDLKISNLYTFNSSSCFLEKIIYRSCNTIVYNYNIIENNLEYDDNGIYFINPNIEKKNYLIENSQVLFFNNYNTFDLILYLNKISNINNNKILVIFKYNLGKNIKSDEILIKTFEINNYFDSKENICQNFTNKYDKIIYNLKKKWKIINCLSILDSNDKLFILNIF